MLDWHDDRKKIINKIASRKSSFKIILKTYNDGFFLEKWIKHHGEVVGYENLIIADNMSDELDVLDVYDRYRDVMVFGFKEHHNRIHDPNYFSDLYSALKISTDHTLLIDTDEFLYFYDNVFRSDSTILSVIQQLPESASVPCLWVENREGCRDQFVIEQGNKKLIWGLCWGKPIVSTSFNMGESLIHSVQFPKENFWTKGVPGVFFLIHYNKLSARQRIKVNFRKLVRHKVISQDQSLEEVFNIEESIVSNPTMRRFLREIREAYTKSFEMYEQHIPLDDGYYRLLNGGSLQFFNSEQQRVFESFISHYDEHLETDFGSVGSINFQGKVEC